MTVPQITIRVSAASKAAFEQYAEMLGLDASALIKLLIVREGHQRRLARSKRKASSSSPVTSIEKSRKTHKVTAHFSSIEPVAEFDEYAKDCGLNRSAAGAWLLEGELDERWLEKAVHANTP